MDNPKEEKETEMETKDVEAVEGWGICLAAIGAVCIIVTLLLAF
jgi:hypothetical protein